MPSRIINKIVDKYHYSGKHAINSVLDFGVFYKGVLLGAMQFGTPMNKKVMMPLVDGSQWHDMVELNRMAFSDALPRFSESRALAMAFKWMKKNSKIKWIISFADGCQCGHGTIYQASNFKLTSIKKNTSIVILPDGEVVAKILFGIKGGKHAQAMRRSGYSSVSKYLNEKHKGWKVANGYMYRYIYFLDKEAEKNFTGEYIPFSKIKELDIEMYKGEWINGANK